MRSFSAAARVLPFLVVLALARSAPGQPGPLGEENRAELEIRRWTPEIVSDLEIGTGTGPTFPAEDLGLGEQTEIEYRGYLRVSRRVKIRASRVLYRAESSRELERELGFAGALFPPGATVDTNLEIELLKGGVEIDLLRSRDGFLAVVAEYHRTEARPELSGGPAGRVRSSPLRVQLPIFGVKGRVYLTPALALTVEATGMRRESEGVITDLDGAITYHLSRNLGFSFGYRNAYTKWKGDGGDRATFRLKGMFLSASVRF